MLYLSIGELARQSGTRTSALRYYESLGLLPTADREGGRRYWPAATLRRIALIKMSQRAGFTLAEIRQLLDSETSRGATRQWRAFAERKLPTSIAPSWRASSCGKRWPPAWHAAA